jgi:hypothetical protein
VADRFGCLFASTLLDLRCGRRPLHNAANGTRLATFLTIVCDEYRKPPIPPAVLWIHAKSPMRLSRVENARNFLVVGVSPAIRKFRGAGSKCRYCRRCGNSGDWSAVASCEEVFRASLERLRTRHKEPKSIGQSTDHIERETDRESILDLLA